MSVPSNPALRCLVGPCCVVFTTGSSSFFPPTPSLPLTTAVHGGIRSIFPPGMCSAVPCAPFPLLPGNTRHSHHHGKYGSLYENMGSAAKIKERLPRDLLEGGLLHPYAIATWTDREEKGAAVTWLGLPPCKSTPAARRPCHLVCTLQEVAELCLTARKKLQINSQGQACIKEYPN